MRRPPTPSSATKNGSDGSVERAARGEDDVDRVRRRPARHRRERRLDGGGFVGQVVEAHDRGPQRLDLVPDAALEPLAIGRPQRFLDQHADSHRHERRHRDQRPAATSRDRHAPLDDRRGHDVRGDLHRRDQLPRRHDGPVEGREDLERIDPVEQLHLARPDVEDARVRGHQVDAALVRAALLEARATDGGGEPQRGLVLVEVAWLHHEDGDGGHADLARVGARQGREVGGVQPPALRPPGAAHAQVTREDRPAQVIRRAAARHDPLEPHASGPGSPTPLSSRGPAPPGSPAACRRPPSPRGTRRRHGCRR